MALCLPSRAQSSSHLANGFSQANLSQHRYRWHTVRATDGSLSCCTAMTLGQSPNGRCSHLSRGPWVRSLLQSLLQTLMRAPDVSASCTLDLELLLTDSFDSECSRADSASHVHHVTPSIMSHVDKEHDLRNRKLSLRSLQGLGTGILPDSFFLGSMDAFSIFLLHCCLFSSYARRNLVHLRP